MAKIGERVGAILGQNEEEQTCKFFGYGIYEGDFVLDENVKGHIADMMRELKIENPRIRLDTGKFVYGCECWWGSEKEIQEMLKKIESQGYTIKIVDIDDARNESE